MGAPGERVVFREPPVKAGKYGLKAVLQPLREMLISASSSKEFEIRHQTVLGGEKEETD